MAGSEPQAASPVPPDVQNAYPRSVSLREGDYFDSLIQSTGNFDPFLPRGWATLRQRFEQMIHPSGTLRILDVGCGTGQSRQIYIRHAECYVGIDLSQSALVMAAAASAATPGETPGGAAAPSIATHWLRADACQLPLAASSFDLICFSSVLHHIPDYSAALVEAMRVLRPGGAAFAFDPNVLHPAMALLRHPRSPLYLRQGVSPHERPLLPAALRRAFAAAGFVSIAQRGQSDIPYRSVAPRGISRFLRLYNRADWLLEHSGLGQWFGTFVLTVGRKQPIQSAPEAM